MAERRLERLTAQDLLMLVADDFGWSEDIGVAAILGGTPLLRPHGPIPVDEAPPALAPPPPPPPPADEAGLLAACARLYRPRLDPTRPLWEASRLPGLPGR